MNIVRQVVGTLNSRRQKGSPHFDCHFEACYM